MIYILFLFIGLEGEHQLMFDLRTKRFKEGENDTNMPKVNPLHMPSGPTTLSRARGSRTNISQDAVAILVQGHMDGKCALKGGPNDWEDVNIIPGHTNQEKGERTALKPNSPQRRRSETQRQRSARQKLNASTEQNLNASIEPAQLQR